jgi:hypothetical protein
MATRVYLINKGINKSVEFKGLKAQYIWYLGGGLVGTLIFFAILYISGLNQYLCVLIALSLISTVVLVVFRMSKKYGEFGLMKKNARRNVPSALRARSRKSFIKK